MALERSRDTQNKGVATKGRAENACSDRMQELRLVAPPQTAKRRRSTSLIPISLAWSATLAIVTLTYREYMHNPFRSGNRRWVSWADSLWSMYCFRRLLPEPIVPAADSPIGRRGSVFFAASPRNNTCMKLRIVLLAVAMKFGGGCVVSLLLHQIPVLFKGWRVGLVT